MNCWTCQQVAVGACRFCGRGTCPDHVATRAFPIAVYRGGPDGTPRTLVVEDALHCGECMPRPDPIDLPELDA